MDGKPLPRPPAENVPESQATERTPDELVTLAKKIVSEDYSRSPLRLSDPLVWETVKSFYDHTEAHFEDVKAAVLRWLGSDTDNTRTAVLKGCRDASTATLVCLTDWAIERDVFGVGSCLKPIIPRLGLDYRSEIILAMASRVALIMGEETEREPDRASHGGEVEPLRRIFETALGLWESDRAIPNGEPQQSTEMANPVKARPGRRRRTEWPQQAQEKVAEIWQAWRQRRNTQGTGGREVDCFEKHKTDLPECIKTVKDFHACKESARKNGLIPKYNRKRRKSAG
ncbi:MAG TPA: hypothetical protein P5527_05560 [Kiritimatiellia bacterium]|nr:hypothetical protein [Kiritimatiellia bacterium]